MVFLISIVLKRMQKALQLIGSVPWLSLIPKQTLGGPFPASTIQMIEPTESGVLIEGDTAWPHTYYGRGLLLIIRPDRFHIFRSISQVFSRKLCWQWRNKQRQKACLGLAGQRGRVYSKNTKIGLPYSHFQRARTLLSKSQRTEKGILDDCGQTQHVLPFRGDWNMGSMQVRARDRYDREKGARVFLLFFRPNLENVCQATSIPMIPK